MPYHWWRNPRQAFARLSCLIAALVPLRVAAQGPDWKAAQDALGRPGAVLAGNVLRVGFPRTDLRVSVGKVRLLPALALGSWVAFAPAPDGALMMGDLVLTEGELQPVMARLLSGGIRVTGIHHHLVGDRPEIFYVHVHARGEPGAMARAIQAALALTGTPPPGRRVVPRVPPFDSGAVARALGRPLVADGGVFKASAPRAGPVTEDGLTVPPALGLASGVGFQPIGRGEAAATGDLVLVASEVGPVMEALRANGVEVTALHNHMLEESPRLFFMHFWATGDAVRIASALHAALDRMDVRPAGR